MKPCTPHLQKGMDLGLSRASRAATGTASFGKPTTVPHDHPTKRGQLQPQALGLQRDMVALRKR